MRIGIDARLWNETGVGRYIRNLVLNLAQIDKKNEYVLFVKKKTAAFDFLVSNKNWKIITSDIHWHSANEQFQFASQLYKENLDLMHFPYYSLPILYRRPFVVTIHDVIIHHFETGKASTLPFPLYALKRLGYKAVLRHQLVNSKKIIVPLEAVKKDLVDTFQVKPAKISVTYEGVDQRFFSQVASLQEDAWEDIVKKPFFLYVGNAYPHKNLPNLLHAFQLFQSSHPEFQLLLVGKKDYFYQQLQHVTRHEQLPNIHFLHNVSDQDLSYLYRHAQALISPSLMEGFGLPPLEAVSQDCPVLLSDISAFKEVWGDTAYYFNPSFVQDIARCMTEFLKVERKEKDLRMQKAKKRVENLSWNSMAKETLRIYESSISL